MEEGELNPSTFPSSTTSSVDSELYNALHQRLVASGEWSRLLVLLRRMLDECGWESGLQQHATEKAKSQPVLSVPDLIDELSGYAKGEYPYEEKEVKEEKEKLTLIKGNWGKTDTLPAHVRTHLLERLRDFLDRNLEDA